MQEPTRQHAISNTQNKDVDHSVIIVGGGPTGLMLAAELKLAGVAATVIERRHTQELIGARAGGLQARTLEILDQRGIVERFLKEGQAAQVGGFAMIPLSIADFPTPHPYGLGLWQNHIERLLADWVMELGVDIQRGVAVTELSQDDDAVSLQLSDGRSLRASYVVGCDGGRSVVRKAAGIAFVGWDASTSNLIAEVEMEKMPPLGIHRTRHGIHSFGRLHYEIVDGKVVFKDEGPIRVMVPEPLSNLHTPPTLEMLRTALIEVCGDDFGVHSPTVLSRFTDAARQAEHYRKGRVLLAGDAAHVHSPVGGQGLNLGIQDAVNLGWKLAQVVKGISTPDLLDTYHTERHPIAARVLRNSLAQVALLRTDDRTDALREILAHLLARDEIRKEFAGMMSGLDLRYDLGEGHPLLGRRLPDVSLETSAGTKPCFELLRSAKPLLLNLRGTNIPGIAPWHERVNLVDARYEGKWELPVVGEVAAPDTLLVRPDGHVAWVGFGDFTGLEAALTRWVGPARI